MNGGSVSISRQAAAALRHASHWVTCHITGAGSGWFVAESSTGLGYSNSTQQTLSINNLLLIDFQCPESPGMHLPLTIAVALVTAPAHMLWWRAAGLQRWSDSIVQSSRDPRNTVIDSLRACSGRDTDHRSFPITGLQWSGSSLDTHIYMLAVNSLDSQCELSLFFHSDHYWHWSFSLKASKMTHEGNKVLNNSNTIDTQILQISHFSLIRVIECVSLCCIIPMLLIYLMSSVVLRSECFPLHRVITSSINTSHSCV